MKRSEINRERTSQPERSGVTSQFSGFQTEDTDRRWHSLCEWGVQKFGTLHANMLVFDFFPAYPDTSGLCAPIGESEIREREIESVGGGAPTLPFWKGARCAELKPNR